MKTMRAIHGIVPVLITPLKSNEDLDEDALRRLMRFLGEKDIGGYWALGTGAEDMNLSFAKRMRVAEIVAEENAGRIPLVMGAGFFAMEDILSFIRETESLNVDAYHVMPYHPLLGLDRLEWYYRHIADNCPKPVWMYTSANWCRGIPPAFVEKMKEYDNIAGIKYSSSNAIENQKVIMMASENFQVITAIATQLYPCLCMGSTAHTTSEASCMPEVFIKIYDYFVKGEHEKARNLQQKFIKFASKFPSGLKNDNFLKAAEEKTILSIRKICEPYTSSYYRDANDSESELIKNLLGKYKLFSDL